MFEELPYIFGFMLLSIGISYLLLKYTSGLLFKVVKGLTMLGIVIHEICHVLMCYITHSPIEKVSLLKKTELTEQKNPGDFGYYGQVKLMEHKLSFLQAFLVSFAPLYLSFWLFFLILGLLLTIPMHPLLIAVSVFLLISLALGSAPSFQDLKVIPHAFSYDVVNSLYQILLISFSIGMTWIVVFAYNLHYLFELLIYLIIAGFYFMFKYGFQVTANLFYSLYERRTNRFHGSIMENKRIFHRRRKPWKVSR